MDWARAIERNSEALKGIIEALFAMLGIAGEATVSRIPQPLHRAVLRVLRPAESAMRRLVVIAARGLVVKPAVSRPMPKGQMIRKGGTPRPSFQLFDPRKNFAELRQHRRRFTLSRDKGYLFLSFFAYLATNRSNSPFRKLSWSNWSSCGLIIGSRATTSPRLFMRS